MDTLSPNAYLSTPQHWLGFANLILDLLQLILPQITHNLILQNHKGGGALVSLVLCQVQVISYFAFASFNYAQKRAMHSKVGCSRPYQNVSRVSK